MAANRGQGGIQQLLAAEQEAQHIVNAAKSGNFSLLYLDLCTIGLDVIYISFHRNIFMDMCLFVYRLYLHNLDKLSNS